MNNHGILNLFRSHDLRIADNPALHAAHREAADNGCALYLLYCNDGEDTSSAVGTWTKQCLNALQQQIAHLGGSITIASHQEIPALAAQRNIKSIHWNRRYTPGGIATDRQLKAALHNGNIAAHSHKASVLFEPFDTQTLNQQGNPYKVYTPFANNLLTNLEQISSPLPAPDNLSLAGQSIGEAITMQALQPWQEKVLSHWPVGEAAAHSHCVQWIAKQCQNYCMLRDIPSETYGTSKLSPWLNTGVLSPRQIIYQMLAQYPNFAEHPDLLTFCKEVLWREFAYHILYHFPDTLNRPFQQKFNQFPWQRAEDASSSLQRWEQGQTGIPIIDAGMRQLWVTGWMHNRVRMLVASYLTKNLRLHWQCGADWFMHTLIDADLASNTMGWQWVAGCGVDAAPYFRIFNPLTQAEKFDPQARYLKQWLPELAHLSAKQCFAPWAHVKDYPQPEVDIKVSRQAALELFKAL
ncbi:DNA photolyase family protein [Cardiobacteriaceae bacterium TAE3-ERU3]|nr:DNA photolyase family protein [Cardiobacteriaceae bacterium TAE3-ERU3]